MNDQAKHIAEYDPVEAGLALLREKYTGVVFDVSTSKGLDDARKARAEIREPRYECERIRKQLKAPALEYSRRIDTEAARITVELEKLESPINDVIKAEEAAAEERRESKRQADIKRQAELRRMVESITAWPLSCLRSTANEIREAMVLFHHRDLPEAPEIQAEAIAAKEAAMDKLREMLAAREAQEAEEARLAAEREAERRRQAEEDKRLREERERLEAERQRQEALRQQALREAAAERERWAREQAAERAETERRAELARIERELAELDRQRIERELADERARIDADRVRVANEDEKAEVPPARVSGTIMRVRFEKRGGHYHCRVFTAKQIGQSFAKNGDLVFDEAEWPGFAKNGDLVFDEAEWPDIPLLMRGAEFVEEES